LSVQQDDNLRVNSLRLRYGAQVFHTFGQHTMVLGGIFESKQRFTKCEYKQIEVTTSDTVNTIGIGLNNVRGDATFTEKRRRLRNALAQTRRHEALEQLALKYMPVHWKLFFFSAKHEFAFAVFVLLNIILKLKGKV
jgi:hypothetical protein